MIMRNVTRPLLRFVLYGGLSTFYFVVPSLALESRSGAHVGIKRSDVVFMGNKGAKIHKIYGGTVVSWGGRPWGDRQKAIEQYRKRVNAAHELGMRYCGGAAFRTAFRNMIDFDPNFMQSVCRALDSSPILVPWLWDQKHRKGYPAYWFCTNAPGYRKYLKHQVKLIMSADLEGLHIDDYNGTAGTEWRGGCFCPHCMKAFREYLKENVSRQRLNACGVNSLDGFDYGKFLRDQGVTVKQYRHKVNGALPLGPEYLTFQYKTAAAWVSEIRRYAEGLVGHRLMLSVNSSASNHKSLLIAPVIDYFCGEVHHGADRGGVPKPYPIWNFKLADAVGRRQVATGSGGDWAYIAKHNKPGLVRTWIAQDYAFGHQLMVPHRQWAYTKIKGTHWYQSQPEDYAHLYRFVRRNAELFDEYEAAASVALLYSNPAFRRNKRGAKDACYWLAQNNVPFHIVVAGDDWLDVKLTPEKLAPYRALVVAEPTCLEGEQKKVIDTLDAQGKVVRWDAKKKALDERVLFRRVPRQISIEGAENIMAVPRIIPNKPSAPALVHLLNRNYDPAKDEIIAQKELKLIIDTSLFGRADFAKAILYAPPAEFDPQNPGASEPMDLDIKARGTRVTIRVPALGVWAIVKLHR